MSLGPSSPPGAAGGGVSLPDNSQGLFWMTVTVGGSQSGRTSKSAASRETLARAGGRRCGGAPCRLPDSADTGLRQCRSPLRTRFPTIEKGFLLKPLSRPVQTARRPGMAHTAAAAANPPGNGMQTTDLLSQRAVSGTCRRRGRCLPARDTCACRAGTADAASTRRFRLQCTALRRAPPARARRPATAAASPSAPCPRNRASCRGRGR